MLDILVAAALLGSVFMGVAIGASSVASAFAPVNSAGITNVLRSALFAGVFAFIGAVVQGGNVTETVGANLLGGEIQIMQAIAILFVGSMLVIISVLTEYPMPTAFTLIGAVIGSAFSFGNTVSWQVFQKIAVYWIIVPFAALLLSYLTALLLERYVDKQNHKRLIDYLLFGSGAYMAYTAGAGSVGLAIGPLSGLQVSQVLLLFIGGGSILLGAWTYSPEIIKAVSYDYSNIGPRRSIAALSSSALLLQIGVFYGIPISLNEAIIAAVIGSGMSKETSNRETKKVIGTFVRWIGAFFLAAFLTFVIGVLAGSL